MEAQLELNMYTAYAWQLNRAYAWNIDEYNALHLHPPPSACQRGAYAWKQKQQLQIGVSLRTPLYFHFR